MSLSATRDAQRRRLLTVSGITGTVYTLSWIVGLSVTAPSPGLAAPGAEIVAAFAEHRTAVFAQFALTEGLPATGLAAVSIALARAAQRSGASAPTRFALVDGWRSRSSTEMIVTTTSGKDDHSPGSVDQCPLTPAFLITMKNPANRTSLGRIR